MFTQLSKQSWYKEWHDRPIHAVYHWLIFILAVILIGMYSQTYIKDSIGGINVVLADDMQNKAMRHLTNRTQKLRQLLTTFQVAEEDSKYDALNDLKVWAQLRQQEIMNNVVRDPDSVLRVAFSESERNSYPNQVQQYIEQRFIVEGEWGIRVLDNFQEKYSREELVINSGNGPVIALFGSQIQWPKQDVKKIRVQGIKIGNNGLGEVMAVDGPITIVSQVSFHEKIERLLSYIIQKIEAYVLVGRMWQNTNITASFVPDGTKMDNGLPSNLFAKFDTLASTATWQLQFARALQTWASVSPLNFHFVPDSGASSGTSGIAQGDSRFGDIRIGANTRSDGYLAYTYYPSSSTLGGDEFLNSSYTFNIGTTYDIYSLNLHEFGHSLGLGHSTAGTVMYGTYQGVLIGLNADDVAGIQAIYGIRKPDSYDSTSSNNTINTATNVNLDSSGAFNLNADLTTVADIDYYKVTAPANFDGTVSVFVDTRNISLLSPKVYIYDSIGNLIGSADAGASYSSMVTLNEVGLTPGQTYYIVTDGNDTFPTGPTNPTTTSDFAIGAYKLTAKFGGAVLTDTTPPTAIIDSLVNGAMVRTTISVIASASDDVGVNKVEFYVDGTLKNTITTTPYSYFWNTTTVADGSHSLMVKSYDTAGNVGTSPAVFVTVDNTAPSTPTNLVTPFISDTEIDLSWTASADVNGISYYKVSRNSTSATTSNTIYIDAGLVSCTSYNYTVTAYDIAGNVSVSSPILAVKTVGCVQDTTLPTITITSPLNGAKLSNKGTTAVKVSASDASGINSIIISFDGVVKKTCTGVTTCSWNINNSKTTTGTHTISSKATDNATPINSMTTSITVTK